MWQLIGVLVSGISMGCVAYALRKFSRNRLPNWLVPAFAGLSMLAFLAVYDYTWYGFKLDQLDYQAAAKQLPADTYQVITTERKRDFFRPWSYIYPAVSSFKFIDNDYLELEQQGARLIQYIEYEFFQEHIDRLEHRTYLLNCTRAERVLLDDKAQAAVPLVLEQLETTNPIMQKYCLPQLSD